MKISYWLIWITS